MVVGIVLWPSPGDQPPNQRSARPRSPSPAPLRGAVPPAGFVDLLRRYLVDRRIDVGAGDRTADLVCRWPKGRSLLRVNAQITGAVRRWGGRVVAADEFVLPRGERGMEMVLSRGGETRKLRFLPETVDAGEPRLAVVVGGFGAPGGERIDPYLHLPYAITPAVLSGSPHASAAVRRSIELERRPILDFPTVGDSTQAAAAFGKGLDGAPGVTGVAGGSDRVAEGVMRPVLDRMAVEGLFYLDGGTSDDSVLPAEAALRGVRCLSTDVVLDADPKAGQAEMARRLREACDIAAAMGSAVLLAHARPLTLRFLGTAGDSMAARGCRPVPLEELLR